MIFGRIPLLKRSMFSQIHQISIHFVLLFKKTVETYGTIRRHHRQNPTCRLINRASPRADWWFTILYITKLEITSWKTMFFGQEWYYPHTMFILEQKLMIESDWMCVYACAFFCGYSVRIHHPSSMVKIAIIGWWFCRGAGCLQEAARRFPAQKTTSPRT